MTVTALLPVSQRYAQRRDAVFAPVAGRSTLERIVSALASCADVVVCAAAPLVDELETAFAAQNLPGVRLVVSEGPGLRSQCIAAGLRAVADGPARAVLLHDLRWPLVASAVVERVVAALDEGAAAALPICPVTDSVKAVDGRGAVTATVDRAPLRTVQYPRGFDTTVLAKLITAGAPDAFDELDAVLSAGIPITLVDGDNDTMSVELPDDASYLAAIIEGTRHLPAG